MVIFLIGQQLYEPSLKLKRLTRLNDCALQADAKPIESCLSDGSIGMSRAIMEGIASGSVLTVVDVKRFVQCTLLAATEDFQASISAEPTPCMDSYFECHALLNCTEFRSVLNCV